MVSFYLDLMTFLHLLFDCSYSSEIVRYIPDGAFTALFAKRRCVWVLLKIMQVEQMLGDTL